MMQTEEKPLRFIRGIGPKRSEALGRLGVESIRDLCYFFPRRHEDRTHFESIAHIQTGKEVTIRCEVLALGIRRLKRINIFEMMVGDSTGLIPAIWFNQPYLKNQFAVGNKIILSGKVERYQDRLQLTSPEYERVPQEDDVDTVHTGRITPVYPLSEGLAQRSLRAAMKEVVDHYVVKEIKEFLPDEIRKRLDLMDLQTAVRTMHFPEELESVEGARKRLIFDEFLIFELVLLSKIRAVHLRERAYPFRMDQEWLEHFYRTLPFHLTADQEKATQEIVKDIGREIPMNRLLQGDVGAGKTVVAACILYLGAKNGLQSALLVPTEILAEQHFQTLSTLFKSLDVSVTLLTGSIEEENRNSALRKIKAGEVSVIVGTHALLQEDVQFKSLGLVIIDEQHRFGVRQRAQLIRRKPRPHLLVMTATPIPRTLGLTLYGDLDISTIRELPKERKKIRTYWMNKDKESEVLEHIRSRVLEHDEQAYILFPIIDETDHPDRSQRQQEQYVLSAAKQEYERLRRGLYKDIPIGLVHGRLIKKERDGVMEKFYGGEIKILVTTSIVEVGVHNPNVTCMVIEHAERFGLSQLHQMRGRIGRGGKEASCFLFGNPATDEGKLRLHILTQTQDGFVIAEEDLKLRGPGDFFGTKQSGVPFFQLADLIWDGSLLDLAREEAKNLLDDDPTLSKREHEDLVQEMDFRRKRFRLQ